MGRIIVCRHGNTFDKGETVTRVGGRTDLPLSVSGRAQADALAQQFSGVRFAGAYCSALQRTRETAEAILGADPDAPALTVLPFLTEVDYGPDENQPEKAVEARLGKPALEAWDDGNVVPDGWQVDVAGIREGWAALLRTAAEMPEDARLLVVTSNGVARFLPELIDETPDGIDRKLKTGAWGEVDCGRGHSRIVDWNRRPD